MKTQTVFVDRQAFDLAEQLASPTQRLGWSKKGYQRFTPKRVKRLIGREGYLAIKIRHLIIVRRYKGTTGKIVFKYD